MVSISSYDYGHIDLGRVVSKKTEVIMGKKIIIIKTENGEIVLNNYDYQKIK